MAILRNQNAGGTLQQTNAGNMRNGGRVNRWTKPMMSRGGRTRPMMSRGGLTLDVSKAKALAKRKRLNRSASSLRGRRPVSLMQHR